MSGESLSRCSGGLRRAPGYERRKVSRRQTGARVLTRDAHKQGQAGLCCKSRRSRRMIVAQRFIGGSEDIVTHQSAKRTAEIKPFGNHTLSVVRSTFLSKFITHPALKRWATLIQCASRTQEKLLLQQNG